ncbi:hypothetical protein BN1013_02407 [Candidatus Rubidus massiliensis]|nr:hypothetical protein BN1013_02407 [Candidatus Rubidus massiliensis]
MALVKYNGKNVYYCNFTSRLMPGINEIPEGELKALLLHPLFQWRVEEGIVVIIPESTEKEADGKKSIKEMMKFIPQIYDHAYLNRIIESDGRDKVVDAAKKQLHKISHQAEEEENEHFRSDTKSNDH